MSGEKVAKAVSFKTPCGGVAHLMRGDDDRWKINKFLPANSGRETGNIDARNLISETLERIKAAAMAKGYVVRT